MSVLAGSFAAEPTQDAFASIVAQTREEKKWYEIEWAKLLSARNCYMLVGGISFLLLTVFGAVTMVMTDDCIVDEPDGRCCGCLQVNSSKLFGQAMTYHSNYNSIFYGIVMIVNSLIGFQYLIQGIRSENKYQLTAVIVTQVLEVLRALFDAWFETNPALMSRFVVREVLAYGSLGTLLISTGFAMRVWSQFGWAVFRRGGTLKPIRELYKVYQAFRGFNRLDVQSSVLLFLVYGLYLEFVQTGGWWIFWCIFICDAIASRYMVKFIKQEDTVGFYITIVAKSYIVIWWIVIAVEYVECRERYWTSLVKTRKFWKMSPYPEFNSVHKTYNGVNCLAPNTRHDDRTLELIFLNLAQALVFRIGSMVYGVRLAAKFGTGLKGVFYKQLKVKENLARQMEAEAAKAPTGGVVVAFKGKRRSAKSGGLTGNAVLDSETELRNQNEDEEDQEQQRSEYHNYENEQAADEAEGGEQDAWEQEHGISRRELEDDLAW